MNKKWSIITVLSIAALSMLSATGRTTFDKLFNNKINWNTFAISELPSADIGATTPAGGTFTSVEVTEDLTASGYTGNGTSGINFIEGRLKLGVVVTGTMTDGSGNLARMTDALSGNGTWTDNLGNGSVTVAHSTEQYRVGTASLKVSWTPECIAGSASVGDGVKQLVLDDDWSSHESWGMWLYSTIALDAGDLMFAYVDTVAGETSSSIGTSSATDFPAVSANQWSWIQGTLTSTSAEKDVVGTMSIIMKTRKGATFDTYIDGIYIWDDADEVDLPEQALRDGIISVITHENLQESLNTQTSLAIYTDYLLNHGTTTAGTDDACVWLTDQSTKTGMILYNYK